MNKLQTLKTLLILGGLYYVVGAIAHFFGLTIFPVYDGALYQPYHDTIITVAAIVVSLLLFSTARDPIKNIDSLNVIVAGGIISLVFMMWMLLKIDFVQLGAPGKKLQTIVEMVLLILFVGSLMYLKPKSATRLS